MQIIRRFECTKCTYIHVFAPKGSSRYKKRVVGFTCPRCGHRPTEAELAKKKGRGPKPKGERRNRSKKVIKEKPKALVPQPYVEHFEWRTSGPPAPGEPRGRAGWRPKPRQPTERTLEEAVVEGFLSDPKRRRKK